MLEKLKKIFTIQNLITGTLSIFILSFITISLDIFDKKHIILFPIYLFFCFGLGAIFNYIYRSYIRKQ
jgi:hypothetical protein